MSDEIENKPVEGNDDEAFIKKYDTLFAFLGLETLALLCFGFGGALGITILRILGAFLAFLTFTFTKVNIDKENRKAFWIGLIPVAALAVFIGFSSFWHSFGGNGLNAIITDATVVIGIGGAFLLGQNVKNIKAAKSDYVLLALGGGLALFVVITGLYSFIRYGFFYSALYNGKVYYYDGVVYTIANETKSLIGFEFLETSMRYGKAASVLLGSGLAGLLFTNPKENPKRFIGIAVLGGIGLLDLILTPYLFGIAAVIGTVAVLGIARLFRFLERKNQAGKNVISIIRKVVFIALIAVVSLGVLFLIIDSSGTEPGKILSKFPIQKIARTVQEGGILYPVEKGINAVLYSTGADGIRHINLMGMLFGAKYTGSSGGQLSRFFEFNVLWQNGFLGFFALAAFCFLMIKQANSFLHKGEDSEAGFRAVLVAVLLAGLVYFSFADDELPLRHADSQLFAFTRNNLSLVLVFLSGLVYQAKAKKEAIHE